VGQTSARGGDGPPRVGLTVCFCDGETLLLDGRIHSEQSFAEPADALPLGEARHP
jgi:hypothetical protein